MFKRLAAPVFETERLYIRLIDSYDYPAMFEISSDPRVTEYLTFKTHNTLSETKRVISNMISSYFAGASANFSVIYKPHNKMIASISLTFNEFENSAEVGYLMHQSYWNCGLMSEAINALVKIAFNYYKLDILYAKHISQNIASQRVLEKTKFTFDSISEKIIKKGNMLYDTKTII